MNITRSMLLSLDELENLTDVLLSYVNIFKISLYNNYTGMSINPDLFRIYVNGTQISDTTITTIANYLDIEVRDLWNRTIWRNITNEHDIRIYLPLGSIIILNELEESLEVLIAPENETRSLSFILPPLSSIEIDALILTPYNITVLRGNRVFAKGVFFFTNRSKGEPMIILRVSEERVVLFTRNQNEFSIMLIGILSGIGLSGISTGVYKFFIGRRYAIRAEEILRHIMTEGGIRIGEEERSE